MPEVFGSFSSNRSELFSRLFYLAASRLNSPRFPFVLIRPLPRECQAGGEMSKVWFRLAGWMAKVDRGMQALLHLRSLTFRFA